MEWLKKLDEQLLLFINKDFTNSIFDSFFPWMTDLHKNFYFSGLLIPLLFVVIIFYYRKIGAWLVLGLVMTLSLNDFIGGKVIKPFFARPRPNHADLGIILRAPEFGGYSFISNHSANMFCLATFILFFFPRTSTIFYLFAFLTAYSRVYVGVHYPSDVLGGALVGMFIGTVCGLALRRKLKWQK